MANKEKLHSMHLVLMALFFVFLVSNSAVALAVQETKISKDIGENGEPAIYGDKVTWAYWDKIHLYDLKTGNDTTITMPEPYYAAHPAIYDNKIVYCLYNVNENPVSNRLCVYDILNFTSSLIAENVSYCVPDIYDDKVVWAEGRNYRTDVYMYDISSQMKTQITTSGSASNPSIYENKIVWEDSRGNETIVDKNNNSVTGKLDIYMYDLSAREETRISTSGLASNPAIYNDRIVWQDSRNSDSFRGIGDVYMYDLSTQKESRISHSRQSSSGSSPAIYGDRIVWCDLRKDSNIYMYDLSTKKETQITTSGHASNPDIYGNIIVDMDNREGLPPGDGYYCDIYMYDLNTGPIKPEAAFLSNVTCGPAPLVILFTDTSTGGVPTSWLWDFGDCINSKHAVNSTHTFTKPGNYTISLTVGNAAGNSTVTKPSYIVVTDPCY